jgi:hypothetical protein
MIDGNARPTLGDASGDVRRELEVLGDRLRLEVVVLANRRRPEPPGPTVEERHADAVLEAAQHPVEGRGVDPETVRRLRHAAGLDGRRERFEELLGCWHDPTPS